MFKNATIYRVPGLPALEAALTASQGQAFHPCGPTQPQSYGWAPPRGHANGALIEAIGQQWILKLCIETRAVPAQAVKKALDEAASLVEKETGRRPRGKRLKEMKEEVIQTMMPKAFPKTKACIVWIDCLNETLVIDTASESVATLAAILLQQAFGPDFKPMRFLTKHAPSTLMQAWLKDGGTSNVDFSIGASAKLEGSGDTGESVTYTNRELDTDEVKLHLSQGSVVASLAVHWGNRAKFTMTSNGSVLRGIKLTDAALISYGGEKEDSFDADVAIYTGELARLIPDFWAALGGEYTEPPPF